MVVEQTYVAWQKDYVSLSTCTTQASRYFVDAVTITSHREPFTWMIALDPHPIARLGGALNALIVTAVQSHPAPCQRA